jgi:hypothetical protein
MMTYLIFKNSDKSFYLGTSTVNSNFETEEFVINQCSEYKENFNYTYNNTSASDNEAYAEAIEGSEIAIDADLIARMNAEIVSNQYQQARRDAYPPLEDQLDNIFHNGIDAWKADIQAIKDANPKPS